MADLAAAAAQCVAHVSWRRRSSPGSWRRGRRRTAGSAAGGAGCPQRPPPPRWAARGSPAWRRPQRAPAGGCGPTPGRPAAARPPRPAPAPPHLPVDSAQRTQRANNAALRVNRCVRLDTHPGPKNNSRMGMTSQHPSFDRVTLAIAGQRRSSCRSEERRPAPQHRMLGATGWGKPSVGVAAAHQRQCHGHPDVGGGGVGGQLPRQHRRRRQRSLAHTHLPHGAAGFTASCASCRCLSPRGNCCRADAAYKGRARSVWGLSRCTIRV